MAFLDEVKDWAELDAAALALGRALGLFSATTSRADARAVLGINGAAGSALSNMLERLVWLGVLEQDEGQPRYRATRATLHPLSPVDGVPSLERGPPAGSRIQLTADAEGPVLEGDRAGFRFLARALDEIAGSALDSGWQTRCAADFRPGGDQPTLTIRLVDAQSGD